ncbi:MAG: hypothetical protein RLZZ196_327 [Bacteroidota bacterium]|jgi:ABC-type proline/glycine betaine transport system permease subunit
MSNNKKLALALIAIASFIAVTILGYKSLESLNQLDLSDPFDVELDDE